jgi:hypothetical protein
MNSRVSFGLPRLRTLLGLAQPYYICVPTVCEVEHVQNGRDAGLMHRSKRRVMGWLIQSLVGAHERPRHIEAKHL